MKIIHTSDWHLGHRLYNWDRSDEEGHFFGQLRDLVAQERPDALLVGGDVFHTGAPGNDVAKVFTDRLLDVVATAPDMETIVIAGNHDSYSRLLVDQSLWRSCRVHIVGVPAEDGDGRAVFADNVIRVGEKGLVAAVPFCHRRNFPLVEGMPHVDRQKDYFSGLGSYVEGNNPARRPVVLMAHLAVGRETCFTGQDRGGVIGGEECVDVKCLGEGYDYVALGHIHCPQFVDQRKAGVRYCGTPRAIHFDETYPHGVDVVELEPGAGPTVTQVEFNPLRPLVTLGGAAGGAFEDVLGMLKEEDLPPETYVRLNVALKEGALPGADWTERARQVAEGRNLRFCLVNPVREVVERRETEAARVMTVNELHEMSDADILGVLDARQALTPEQRRMLADLMANMPRASTGV